MIIKVNIIWDKMFSRLKLFHQQSSTPLDSNDRPLYSRSLHFPTFKHFCEREAVDLIHSHFFAVTRSDDIVKSFLIIVLGRIGISD